MPHKGGHLSYKTTPTKGGHLSYKTTPTKGGHLSYKTTPTKGHPSYKARLEMHWYREILLNCTPQERPPLFKNKAAFSF